VSTIEPLEEGPANPSSGEDAVRARLEADRRDLLDLSLRNPLLNYRPRARGLTIVGESSAELFRILVREGRRMTFLPAPDPPKPSGPDSAPSDSPAQNRVESHTSDSGGVAGDERSETPATPDTSSGDGYPGLVPSIESSRTNAEPIEAPGLATDPAAVPLTQPEEPPAIVADQTDLKLQTDVPSDKLQSRLLSTFFAARTSLEEQGVNTLFLALGMLSWREADSSATALRAPWLLIPVARECSSASERFRLRYTGEDLGVNLSLSEKMRADFGIALPDLPDADELDVVAYFDAIADAVKGRPRWSVDRDAVALGFFSFGKFLMYRDLDEETWPEGAKPGAHPILRALLRDGFREPEPTIGEDDPLDRHLAPGDVRHVVDADSSQVLALIDANAGRNLVIQGPPGTGKSQTITNLIAEAVGRGKSVLFVSEKMAALEVVKRRLDAAGLGGACLELHSHKTNKKAVLADLRETLDLGRPRLGAIEDDLRMLGEVRDRLNDYCEAVNAPIDPSGVTPHQAIGAWLGLRGVAAPPIELPDPASWSSLDFRRRSDLVEQLQARLGKTGIPKDHPFWGSRRAVLLPTEAEPLRQVFRDLGRASATLRDAASDLARFLRLPAASDRAEAEALLRAAAWAARADSLRGVQVQNDEWQARAADLQELLDAGTTLAELHRRHDATLLPEAWGQDLLETRQVFNTVGRRWWRLLSGEYRRARRRLASLCRGPLPRPLDDRLALADAVIESRRRQDVLRRHESLAACLFGAQWQDDRSNWSALANVFRWMLQIQLDVREGRVPPGILDFLATNPAIAGLETLASAVQTALGHQAEAARALQTSLEFDAPARFGAGATIESLRFDDLDGLLRTWSDRVEDLQSLVAFNNLAGRCRADGLGGVVSVAESWPDAGRHLADAFRRRYYEGLLTRAFREREPLAGADGTTQEHRVRSFCDLDRRSLRHNRARLAHDHWRELPRHEGGGQLAVLRREFEKKARHLPVRQLIARAGNAVKAIKPVFMMSPMSIATYLPPNGLQFDLVVFDEASQVRPVEAFGALLRGRQAVVVGDSRQLPPTSFFDRLTAGADEADDDEESAGDVESILGLFVARNAPQRMLRWHYRSRHESLIAVSNHEFYDGRLVVFPSPDAGRRDAGLVFHHLPVTSYDRGKTRTNPGEAEAVATAVMEHARAQLGKPADDRLTLGVAAFSMPQMQAILDRLEVLRRQDPSCEEFFALGTAEPFFVKNLENVQGDERDVMFISVGYGRSADGVLSMNFGPLNGEGGERRLNVLITRARVRCEVFTNLTADDIDLDRTRARGVAALKTFLAYAQTGRLDVSAPTGHDPDSPFEEAVLAALAARGHRVVPQVGSAGFRVDLAVVDPDRPGRYLLGIECDGASYHSARSARDRDRLRQQVLEALGWRIHRIWSTDWFRDPESELRRVLAAIEGAKAPPSGPEPVPDGAPVERDGQGSNADAPPGEPEAPATDIPAYRFAHPAIDLDGRELHEVPAKRLASRVAEVVRVEGPIHADEVARRIADAAGVRRIGNRIQAALDAAIGLAAREEKIQKCGDFLWPAGMSRPAVRDRGNLPAVSRKLDLVAPEEIAAAIEKVVSDSFGMEPVAIPPAACRLLGFPRVSDEMRVRVESIIGALIEEKRLATQGNHLVVPKGPDDVRG
jgi:very-short-patch-repair endonuclease